MVRSPKSIQKRQYEIFMHIFLDIYNGKNKIVSLQERYTEQWEVFQRAYKLGGSEPYIRIVPQSDNKLYELTDKGLRTLFEYRNERTSFLQTKIQSDATVASFAFALLMFSVDRLTGQPDIIGMWVNIVAIVILFGFAVYFIVRTINDIQESNKFEKE